MATIDYQTLLASNLRGLRVKRGWTQVELASNAREFGLAWTADTVVAIESGRRVLNAGEVLLAPALFGVGFETLADHPGDQEIDVDGCIFPAVVFRSLVAGGPIGGLNKLREVMVTRDRVVNREASNEAEKKAARSLGISAVDLVFLAHDLWNRGLTDERDARVTAEAGSVEVSKAKRQALRGHITRGLLAELRQSIEASKGQP